MRIPYFIKEDGIPFTAEELKARRKQLISLSEEGTHLEFMDDNTTYIAQHPSPRIIIVSGPGTGKSKLFIERIKYWLKRDKAGRILVTSFVNKLVSDLEDAIQELPENHRERVTVWTLHRLARSIVEKNGGTVEWPFKRYIKVISQYWKDVVWSDVLQFAPSELKHEDFTWNDFEKQLFNAEFQENENWQFLKQTYYEICRFYNAAGFSDLIIRATDAVKENEALREYDYFIIDEFQDFNNAEYQLLQELWDGAKGVLIVGDDDQVLYDSLKNGKASLIREIFREDESYAKATLPFCRRCNYHIVRSAEFFKNRFFDPDRLPKILLPICREDESIPIRIIACAHPSSAVRYIEGFIREHEDELNRRRIAMEQGSEKDAFLLILTPKGEASFLQGYEKRLKKVISRYFVIQQDISQSHILASYYYLAKYPKDNFEFRKVLHYEGISPEGCHSFIREAIETGVELCALDNRALKDVLWKCECIRDVLDGDNTIEEKTARISGIFENEDFINVEEVKYLFDKVSNRIEEQEDENGREEISGASRMNPIELMTITKSKGLTADHVIILGFDDVNMSKLSPNAFYVSITRARKSLHLITSLGCGGTKAHSYLEKLPEGCLAFYKYTKKGLTSYRRKGNFCGFLDSVQSKRK